LDWNAGMLVAARRDDATPPSGDCKARAYVMPGLPPFRCARRDGHRGGHLTVDEYERLPLLRRVVAK
jgi:hypothetical protein